MPSAAVAGKDGFRVSDGAREGIGRRPSQLYEIYDVSFQLPDAHSAHTRIIPLMSRGREIDTIYEDET